ncbi:class I SAM-dependent methyltransferase [Haloplasma contractile]|nr:class I SAM-dependent methyltransferase [Haloplasma contractile]
MRTEDYVTTDEEKKRYESHNNDVNDPRYQKFVSPIVDTVTSKYSTVSKGLDFGAGTGPVITKMLGDKGYDVALYDPFFWNNEERLKTTYDFIVCCEVIEHFHSPWKEFKLLRSLLKDGGTLYLKTDIYTDDTDFKRWYYKNDPTHVFFYHPKAFEWIKEQFGFSTLKIEDRLITLSV